MSFKILTLGCKVNTYESNVMRELLLKEGYSEVSHKDDADIVIINTCSVTNVADQKSRKMIRKSARSNPKVLCVVGCMSQHEYESLLELNCIDILLGNSGKSDIVLYIKEFLKTKKPIVDIKDLNETPFEDMNLVNFNQTRAFVKIEDGCENFCTYCIIPYTRGPVKSRRRENILEEVCELVRHGHKEVVLTGIHTGHYGSDLKDLTLTSLLEDLIKIPGLERIRISSIEMNEITSDMLKLMRDNKVLVRHMHIPLQSGSEDILKAMHRKYTKQEFIDKISEIRSYMPDISITTDVIVGFPGETEELFNETIETVKKIGFAKIHVFPYSKRNGTVAASLENQVLENIKKERVHKLLSVSKELENNYMNKFIGKVITFLPEIEKDGYIIGHTGNYLLVKVPGTKDDLNKTTKVILTSNEYPYMKGDIYAEI